MTLTYSGQVATARLGAFARLLFHWKGSIYKLIYQEMLIFASLYATISIVYRHLLSDLQKRSFEKFALYCEAFINLIPLSFILGFYVAIIVARWWNQFIAIPWPDSVVMYITTMIDGLDDQGRIIRRTLVRYITLATLLVFQATSISVKKRFPTMLHILEAGVMTDAESKALDNVVTSHGKWWVPFAWAVNLVKHARKTGRIADDYLMKTVIDVTTLAVYSFFVGCIFGRQFLDPSQGYPGHTVDIYVPVFTLLQFFFYMGWLKVAEQLINPFGEDDDDFEMNWIIDRSTQLAMLVADDLHNTFPALEKDIYFGESHPDCLPYTRSSISSLKDPFMGSTANLSVSDAGMQVVMETIPEGLAVPVSHMGSPMPSPGRTHRHLHQNLMSVAAHSQMSLSRSELDMNKLLSVLPSQRPATPPVTLGLSKAVSICMEGTPTQELMEGERRRAGSLSHRFAPSPLSYVPSPLAATTPTEPPQTPIDPPPPPDTDSDGSDVPLIVVDGNTSSSSEDSLSYEPADANQATVTSLTPLLNAVDCMPSAPEADV